MAMKGSNYGYQMKEMKASNQIFWPKVVRGCIDLKVDEKHGYSTGLSIKGSTSEASKGKRIFEPGHHHFLQAGTRYMIDL